MQLPISHARPGWSRLARPFTCLSVCLWLGTGLWATSAWSDPQDKAAPGPTLAAEKSDSVPMLSAQQVTLERQRFLDHPEFSDRFARLTELEQQALALAVDEPLKLGSLGTAILDIYPASQTGHYALSKFYAHVEAADTEQIHLQALDLIQAQMAQSGRGDGQRPYQVMTVYDARAFVRSQDTSPIGAMYQTGDRIDLGYMLLAKPTEGANRRWYFDLSHVVARTQRTEDDPNDAPVTGWTVIRMLAQNMDNAAQTAIGAYLSSAGNNQDAVGWLKVATRTGNVLANTLLARIYLTQAQASSNEEDRAELLDLALENHLHAIGLGSRESMYTLASLYLGEYYGPDNSASAIPLLKQAGDLGHPDALLYLAYLYNTGEQVEQDSAAAQHYYEQAAALNSPRALLSFARFLLSNEGAAAEQEELITALESLAETPHAEAMVALGNLHARGLATRPSNRRAVRWYRKSVEIDPLDPAIVNEVAWTLTVSDVKGLRRVKYARRIMDHLMTGNDKAREQPEYLDTWAAIYAALGDHERAVELQEEAIVAARSEARDDVLQILQDHLELFKAGDTITEKAP
ncbi:MAG: tetratricopeptide repeat protein [Pseudomonadota bacterium]